MMLLLNGDIRLVNALDSSSHGRPHIGAYMGSADPLGKMDEKLKSENMQKRAVFYVFVIF